MEKNTSHNYQIITTTDSLLPQQHKHSLPPLNTMQKEYDETAPVIEEDFHFDDLAEDAFADISYEFSNDEEDMIDLVDNEEDTKEITTKNVKTKKTKKKSRPMNTLSKFSLVSFAVLNTAACVEGIGSERIRRRIRNQNQKAPLSKKI